MTKNKNNKIVIPNETLAENEDRESTIPEKLEKTHDYSSILTEIINSTSYIDDKIIKTIAPIEDEINKMKTLVHDNSIIISNLNGKYSVLVGILLTSILLTVICAGITIYVDNWKILPTVNSTNKTVNTLSDDINLLKEDRKLNSYRIDQLENKTKTK